MRGTYKEGRQRQSKAQINKVNHYNLEIYISTNQLHSLVLTTYVPHEFLFQLHPKQTSYCVLCISKQIDIYMKVHVYVVC